MNRILYVITSYLGPSTLRIGDSLLHTPVIRWLQQSLGFPIDVGGFQEFAWIFERCQSADCFEIIKSPAEAVLSAGDRILIMTDYPIDEYDYEQIPSYTQLIAQRIGIPGNLVAREKIDYIPTETDRTDAAAFLQTLNRSEKLIITVNTKGETRKNQPGLKPDEYIKLCSIQKKKTNAVVLIGDTDMPLPENITRVNVTLPIWGALIEQSDLWIGECTGPYYLACALDKPTVMFCARNSFHSLWSADHYSDNINYIFEQKKIADIIQPITDLIKRIK